ncbi:MAG: prepilin-type N-terminal cleavage/methylation domain-containing protein [Candidatus Electrothrix sp. ATG2]|nr:prepilin-type N-terminal cleavage/methylation domain-containing protein [Candidatus Electrothrix sp. ATG2]
MERRLRNQSGFTFIEMMVAMVIASFVFAGIYGVYNIQQRSYTVQEQVSEMQQRLRAAVQFMVGEMRMAGYDPPNDYPDPNAYDPDGACDDAGIKTMQSDELAFQFCRVTASNGDPPVYTAQMIETRYLHVTDETDEAYETLKVQHDAGKITLAEGIEAIEFLYLDADGAIVTNTTDIRQVKISILARSTYPDRKHTDTTLYQPASMLPPFNLAADPPWGAPPECADPDNPNEPCHYHRRLLITTVKLRNMGLE